MLDAVEFVHSLGMAHRDVKIENFVLDQTKKGVKLIDFGFATTGEELESARRDKEAKPKRWDNLWHRRGTPGYTAPEIQKQEEQHLWAIALLQHADVWALGISLYRLASGGKPPTAFWQEHVSPREIIKTGPKVKHMSEDLKELLFGGILVEAGERWSIPEVKGSEWFRRMESIFKAGEDF